MHRLLRTLNRILCSRINSALWIWAQLTSLFVISSWVWCCWPHVPSCCVSDFAISFRGKNSWLLSLSTQNPRFRYYCFPCNFTSEFYFVFRHTLWFRSSSCDIWNYILCSDSVDTRSVVNFWIYFIMSLGKVSLVSSDPNVSPRSKHASVWLAS